MLLTSILSVRLSNFYSGVTQESYAIGCQNLPHLTHLSVYLGELPTATLLLTIVVHKIFSKISPSLFKDVNGEILPTLSQKEKRCLPSRRSLGKVRKRPCPRKEPHNLTVAFHTFVRHKTLFRQKCAFSL